MAPARLLVAVLVERVAVAQVTPLVLELVVDLMLMWLPVLVLVVALVLRLALQPLVELAV